MDQCSLHKLNNKVQKTSILKNNVGSELLQDLGG